MRIIRRVLLLIVCTVASVYTVNTIQFDSLCREDERKYLLTSTGEAAYGFDTDNTVYTNLTGLSNAILRLEEEGYRIYSTSSDENSIDIIIQDYDKGIVYRYYYTYNNKLLTCFCNEYEDSYKALTYIIE